MIGAFTFNTSHRVVFENGSAGALSRHAGNLLGERPFIITDKGIINCGLIDACLIDLKAAGCQTAHYEDVLADPPRRLVEDATQKATDHGATCIIGFGGGSSLDIAKLVALLASSGEDLDDAWGIGNAKGPRLPLVLIPTTAGTGSEVTPISIITLEEDEKRGVVSPILLPDLAVLDLAIEQGMRIGGWSHATYVGTAWPDR